MGRFVAAVLVVAGSVVAFAQQPQAPPPALALGSAPGSWVADVTTTGGYTGRGTGSVSIRSDGAAECAAPLRCDGNAEGGIIARLGAAIETARGVEWQRPVSRTTCNDCIVTTLTIRARQEDGTATRVVYSWDNVDGSQLPRGVRGVYDAVMNAVRR